jgi:hypothetical protein
MFIRVNMRINDLFGGVWPGQKPAAEKKQHG